MCWLEIQLLQEFNFISSSFFLHKITFLILLVKSYQLYSPSYMHFKLLRASLTKTNLSHLWQQSLKLFQVQGWPAVGGAAVGSATKPVDGD